MADDDGSKPAPETIDVRSDERFDEARVARYLRDVLPGADAPMTVRQFGGGHANLTYLVTFGSGAAAVEYVLRRPPLGPVAPAPPAHGGGGRAGGGGPLSSRLLKRRVRAARPGGARTVEANRPAAQPRPPDEAAHPCRSAPRRLPCWRQG